MLYIANLFFLFERVSTGAANNYTDLVFTTKDTGNFMGKHYYAPIGICLKINESPDEL